MPANASWMSRIPSLPHPQKFATPREATTVTSLRSGQYPRHPRAMKQPKPEKPPNFADDGQVVTNLTPLPPNPEIRFPMHQMSEGTWSENLGSPVIPDETAPEEDLPEDVPTAPNALIEARNAGMPENPLATPPFVPKDREGNPVTPDSFSGQLAQYPEMKSPKWWQRLAAAAVGAGEGVANAGGHMRHPIDIGASSEAIQHPGYAGKFAEWQSRVIPQQLQLQLAAQMRAAQLAQQKMQMDAERTHAQAAMNNSRAKNYESLADTRPGLREATPELEALTKGVVKAGTQLTPREIEAAMKLVPGAKNVVLNPGGQLVDGSGRVLATNSTQKPGAVNEWTLRQAAANGDEKAAAALKQRQQDQIAAKLATRKGPDPVAAEMRQQRMQDQRAKSFDDIEKAKQAAITQAQRQFRADNNKDAYLANPQRAQDVFQDAVRRHGGGVEPQQVRANPKGDAEWVPKKPSAPAARPPLSAFEKK